MTGPKHVLVTGVLPLTDSQREVIRELGFEVHLHPKEKDPLSVDPALIDAVICNRLFDFQPIESFTGLRLIQLTSAGTDQLPADLAARGIEIRTARDVYSIPIAEWVVLKLLDMMKMTRQFERSQHEHAWQKQRNLRELSGLKAVIIGYGSIGRETAKRLQAFDVDVTAVGRRPDTPPHCDQYIQIAELDSHLPAFDLVIVTLPLTEQTHHFLNEERLQRLKPGCLLVNVSRGAIIDESALLKVLQQGRIGGAALDVFEQEPLPTDHPFWSMEQVLVSPHNSFVSDRNLERLFAVVLNNLRWFVSC